jgi:hypothetical protein
MRVRYERKSEEILTLNDERKKSEVEHISCIDSYALDSFHVFYWGQLRDFDGADEEEMR